MLHSESHILMKSGKANSKAKARGKSTPKVPAQGVTVTVQAERRSLGTAQEQYMSLVIASINHLKSLDALSDIVKCDPLTLTEGGGSQSPFDAGACEKALGVQLHAITVVAIFGGLILL